MARSSYQDISQKSIEDLVNALDARTDEYGPDDPETLAAAHRLAVAFWSAGDPQNAIALLDQILQTLAHGTAPLSHFGVEALSTLGKILFEERQTELACVIHREVLDFRVHHCGSAHPDSLAAQGDLATVLLELGHKEESERLERDAYARARRNLTIDHPVRSVLAWHVALTCQRNRDDKGYKRAIQDLLWLLAEEQPNLSPDHGAVRTLLAARLRWDSPATC